MASARLPSELERLLSGGDLRSTGAADEAARALLAGRWDAEPFLALMEAAEPVVRMRAADALEKATRTRPQLLEGAADRLLALLSAAQPKEVRWHLLQMAPRVAWPRRHRACVLEAVERAFDDTSAIVRVSALQALADLAPLSESLASAFERRRAQALTSGTASLRARARKLGTCG